MRSSWLLPAVLAAAVVVAPASSAARGPQVADPCGDAGTRARVGTTTVVAEPSDPTRDIAAAGMRGVYDGRTLVAVQATLRTCGPVEETGVGYEVVAGFGDQCFGTLAYQQVFDVSAGSGRYRAVFDETCFEDHGLPLLGSRPRVVSAIELPPSAAVLTGDTVTLTLPLIAVPAASAARFADGTRWTSTLASTYGAPSAATGLDGGAAPAADAQVRVDYASGPGWRVGEDRQY